MLPLKVLEADQSIVDNKILTAIEIVIGSYFFDAGRYVTYSKHHRPMARLQ
jgi:hypothetical protein